MKLAHEAIPMNTDHSYVNKQGETVFHRAIEQHGIEIGAIDYIETADKVTILRTDVDTEFQNKGIGFNAYQRFIDEKLLMGKQVCSDSIISLQAQRIYEKLSIEGYIITKASVRMLSSGKITTISALEFSSQRRTIPIVYVDGAGVSEAGYRFFGSPVYTISQRRG
jgi:predicted GNAT family acetyltransferase